MEIVEREIVKNRVIVSVNNEVEYEAFYKLVDMSGIDRDEDFDNMILLNLFGINAKKRECKYGDFKLNLGDVELIKNLGVSEFKVLREVGKLKECNFTLWRDVEVFLLKFTVNEFKFIRGLLREIDYFDEVEFLDNRKRECICNQIEIRYAS